MKKKADKFQAGTLTPIFLPAHFHEGGRGKGLDATGLIISHDGLRAKVLLNGETETWFLADLKKMAAHKRTQQENT